MRIATRDNGKNSPVEGKSSKLPKIYRDAQPLPPEKYPQVIKAVSEISKKAGTGNPVLCMRESEQMEAGAYLYKETCYVSFSQPMLDEFFKDESRMKAVISHEISHIKLKHGPKTALWQRTINCIAMPLAAGAAIASAGFTFLSFGSGSLQSVAAEIFTGNSLAGMFSVIAIPIATVSAAIIAGAPIMKAKDLILNAISRKFEIDASRQAVRLLEGFKELKKGYEFTMAEAENVFSSRPWIKRMKLVGHYEGCESAVIRPKNFFEKIAARIVHFIESDHPKMTEMYDAIKGEGALLGKETPQQA